MSGSSEGKASVWELFREGPYRLLFVIRLTSNTASQMVGVIVSWQIYEITGSALQLGIIGLIQFLPPLALALTAGQVADRYDRRWILRIGLTSQIVVPAGFIVLSNMAAPPLLAFYALLLTLALVRTFDSPAQQAILPSMVPRRLLAQAISLSTSAQKISALLGPALAGVILVFSASIDYGVCLGLTVISALASFGLRPPKYGDVNPRNRTWNTLFSGLGFVMKSPVIGGLISLDLLASLFGGVAALLPIFAKDILDVGPAGLGLLRAGPAIGALMLAVFLARFPVRRNAGRWLFAGVAAYGVATMIFAFSGNMILSMACMLVVGAGDTLGQVLRQTVIQLRTPDAMRGRVAAVSNLSVVSGTQLGQFESGIVAALIGAVGSAFVGGAVALIIVVIWMRKFPAITNIEHPEDDAVP